MTKEKKPDRPVSWADVLVLLALITSVPLLIAYLAYARETSIDEAWDELEALFDRWIKTQSLQLL